MTDCALLEHEQLLAEYPVQPCDFNPQLSPVATLHTSPCPLQSHSTHEVASAGFLNVPGTHGVVQFVQTEHASLPVLLSIVRKYSSSVTVDVDWMLTKMGDEIKVKSAQGKEILPDPEESGPKFV